MLLKSLQAAFPTLAKACEAKRDEMLAVGESEEVVLEAQLKLARPFLYPAPETESQPMSVDDAIAMMNRS